MCKCSESFVLVLPDELLLAVGACALESHLPTIFSARASCKRLQDLLAQLCTTTEGSRRLQWIDELSLKVKIMNLGSTVRSPRSSGARFSGGGTSWACGSLLPPGSWQWSITLDSTLMNETGQFIGVCNESGTVGFGFHPFSGNMWAASRASDGEIRCGDAAATPSDRSFTRAFLGGNGCPCLHLQQILLPGGGMEENEDAMSGWGTKIREGARIDVIFVAENLHESVKSHWLGFRVNGGPLRYAGLLVGAFRVRPWVYMDMSCLVTTCEQLTSSPYLVVDTTNVKMRRDARRAWHDSASVYAEAESGDESGGESEGESGGESGGKSEGESVDENGN